MTENAPLEIKIAEYEGVPNPDYFFGLITTLSFLVWGAFNIYVPAGVYYAYVGSTIATPLIMILLASRGLLDKKFYTLEAKSSGIMGDLILSTIGLISLWSSNKFLGYVDTYIPSNEVLMYFILGFIVIRIVKWIFVKTIEDFGISLFGATILTTILSITAGIVLGVVI